MLLDFDKGVVCDWLGILYSVCCFVLLFGSCGVEVEMFSVDFLKIVQFLCVIYFDLQVVVLLVNVKWWEQFECIKVEMVLDMIVYMLDGQVCDVMIVSDVVLLVFGMVVLECMLVKCLMVVGYWMKLFIFWLVKWLVKIDYVLLLNLLVGCELVKELLQDECEFQVLVVVLQLLLVDGKISYEMYEMFCVLYQQICCNVDEQVVDVVLELVK